jgi:hypothetical protein
MTDQEHIERHIELHSNLDELIADWISQEEVRSFLDRPIKELLEWSYTQTIKPTNKR